MSTWATAYCGICGTAMVAGMGPALRCPNANNAAHNQWQTGNRVELYGNDAIDALQAQITALRAALDQERADNERLLRYARHINACPVGVPAPGGGTWPCDCGLSALLSGRGEAK